MIDKSKTYRTRDGREVRIYATDGGGFFCVHGAIKSEEGRWDSCNWAITGAGPYVIGFPESDEDLIEVRPRIKRTVWLNVYEDNTLSVFGSEAKAKQSLEYCLACVKVEIDCEEGTGL